MAFEQLQDQLTPSMDDEDPRRAGPAPGWSSDPSSPRALETSRRRSHRPWSTVPPRDLTGGLRGQARATKKGTEWLPRQRRNGLVMLGFPSVWSFFWWLFDWFLFLMVLWLFFLCFLWCYLIGFSHEVTNDEWWVPWGLVEGQQSQDRWLCNLPLYTIV